MKQIGVLVHHRYLAADPLKLELAQVAAADKDPAGLWVIEAEQQPHDGRLARSARPDDSHTLASRDVETQARVCRLSAARIGKRDVLEDNRRNERTLRVPGWLRIAHQWLGVEQVEDALRRGESDHALVQDDPEIPQRPEHFNAKHQNDEQGGKIHLSGLDPVGAPAHGNGGADPDSGVGNAAGERVRAHYPHRALEQLMRLGLQNRRALARLPERLECCEPLDRIQEFGRELAVGFLPCFTVLAVQAVPGGRGEQRDQRRNQERERDRQVDEGDETEYEYRRQTGDEELRQILTEIDLKLLNPLDHREDHAAGPSLGEMRRPQLRDVIVDHQPQMGLDDCSRAVRDHVSVIIEPAAQQYHPGDQRDRQDHSLDRIAAEHPGQEPAQKTEPGDTHRNGQQTDEYGPSNAGPHTLGQCP